MARTPEKPEEIAARLKELAGLFSPEEASTLSAGRAKHVRKAINQVLGQLTTVLEGLDPIKNPSFVFDPSNPNVVGRIVALTMIGQDRKPLEAVDRFYGSGVYAIYYKGKFPAYARLSKREHPIYVGKVDPANPAAKTPTEQGDRLANRLRDHRKNISKATSTLRVEDFEYRALVVQSGWQKPAEDYLIYLFQPIWNNEVGICYGFGKHGDDPGTRANLRSPWDTLHPGRDWAHRDPNMKDARSRRGILQGIRAHLTKYPPIRSIPEILRRFLDEIRTVS